MEMDNRLYIYFASQTGNAEEIANNLQADLKRSVGLAATVVNCAKFDPKTFMFQTNKIFVLATHYDGEAPNNGRKFREWILNEKNHKKNGFSHMNYAVFALGDINYKETFTKFGKDVNKLMRKFGASCIKEIGIASNHNGRGLHWYNMWAKGAIMAISSTLNLQIQASVNFPIKQTNFLGPQKAIGNLKRVPRVRRG
jgi:sulfite reductase alpha subunit-like flavoprotein